MSVASAAVRAWRVYAFSPGHGRLPPCCWSVLASRPRRAGCTAPPSEGKVRRLPIANRTLAHAQELASRHGGVALPLTELRPP
ncbi:hypothetical protein ACE0DR_25910, partial [Azotobacter sp. CWF10]